MGAGFGVEALSSAGAGWGGWSQGARPRPEPGWTLVYGVIVCDECVVLLCGVRARARTRVSESV